MQHFRDTPQIRCKSLTAAASGNGQRPEGRVVRSTPRCPGIVALRGRRRRTPGGGQRPVGDRQGAVSRRPALAGVQELPSVSASTFKATCGCRARQPSPPSRSGEGEQKLSGSPLRFGRGPGGGVAEYRAAGDEVAHIAAVSRPIACSSKTFRLRTCWRIGASAVSSSRGAATAAGRALFDKPSSTVSRPGSPPRPVNRRRSAASSPGASTRRAGSTTSSRKASAAVLRRSRRFASTRWAKPGSCACNCPTRQATTRRVSERLFCWVQNGRRHLGARPAEPGGDGTCPRRSPQ